MGGPERPSPNPGHTVYREEPTGNANEDELSANEKSEDDGMAAPVIKQGGWQALADVDAWAWVWGTTFAQLGWSFVIINFVSMIRVN